MPQLELKNLTKNYIVGENVIPAIDNVSLSIEKGEFVSIVGHSGYGKTTFISIIGGILQRTSGQVFFNGVDICSFDDMQLSEYRNKNIGFMFQFASLLPILTALENVLLPEIFSAARKKLARDRAQDFLKLVGIGDKMSAYPSQLSGGQQRRVAIARALMNDPDIILADEPTGDLDEQSEAEIMALFKKINEETKTTILLITHNLELAKQGKKILRMNQNKLIEV